MTFNNFGRSCPSVSVGGVQQQYDNMYISIFSQHNYIFLLSLLCYNTTCFGPLCGPSSGVSRVISHTIAWRGVGLVGTEISLCGCSYYVMHYVILVLSLLILELHGVFRASVL